MRKSVGIAIAVTALLLVVVLALFAFDIGKDYQTLSTNMGSLGLSQTQFPIPGDFRCVNYSTEDFPGPLSVYLAEVPYFWQDAITGSRPELSISFYLDEETNSLVFLNSVVTIYLHGDMVSASRENGNVVGEYALDKLPTNLVVFINGEVRVLKLSVCQPPSITVMEAQASALITP